MSVFPIPILAGSTRFYALGSHGDSCPEVIFPSSPHVRRIDFFPPDHLKTSWGSCPARGGFRAIYLDPISPEISLRRRIFPCESASFLSHLMGGGYCPTPPPNFFLDLYSVGFDLCGSPTILGVFSAPNFADLQANKKKGNSPRQKFMRDGSQKDLGV